MSFPEGPPVGDMDVRGTCATVVASHQDGAVWSVLPGTVIGQSGDVVAGGAADLCKVGYGNARPV